MKEACASGSRKYSQDSYHPYHSSIPQSWVHHNSRQNSISPGYCSSNSSTPSPSSSFSSSSSSTVPPTSSPIHLTNRLRQYIPEIPKDQLSYQILLETLSHVVELEQHLQVLEETARNLRHSHQFANCRQTQNMVKEADRIVVPEDLANVDVSEFKHLVLSDPIDYHTFGF